MLSSSFAGVADGGIGSGVFALAETVGCTGAASMMAVVTAVDAAACGVLGAALA
jgi:hypothetical protein